MKKILFYDTETTGLPNWQVPSGDESQPHLVQLAAVVCNAETQEIIKTLNFIIKPNGWEIPVETSDIHGITTEMALADGVPEDEAFEQFIAMRGDIPRVAHNRTFDQRMLRIAAKRYAQSDDVTDKWAEKDDHECTMMMAKPIMKKAGFTSAKLVDAYKFFTGKDLLNAHTAMGDTIGCMEIYFAIKNGVVEPVDAVVK